MTAAAYVRPAPETTRAISTELRGMAGELMARHDENRHLSAYSAALVLLARAEELEEAA